MLDIVLTIFPSLVNLLSFTKMPNAKLHAALRGVCVTDVLRLRIINEGVLRAFLHIIDAPPSNAILYGFSSLCQWYIDLLQPAALHSIFLLAMGDVVETQQWE